MKAECVAPDVNEDEYKSVISDPDRLALELAIAKAESVFAQNPDAVVIGGDQIATIHGTILGKPGTVENAIEQLAGLSGKTHRLITAVCVIGPGGQKQTIVDHSCLTMRPLEKTALERYVQFDQPFDCAGAYKLESAGISLFERIQTEDHTAITGLPLIALVRVLTKFYVQIP